jgi:starch-binding outer membrane protein, SusD/RagB family
MPPATTLLPPQITTFGRLRPNKETFDSHTTQYPADPRIEATFLYGQFTRHGQPPVKIYPDKKNSPQGFPFMRKHFDVSYNGTTTNRNMIVLRYADVLLMLAEVENELNGPEEAYKYVNRVIARARDTNGDGTSDAAQPADYAGLSKDQFRTRILKERQYELLGEGHEWFDTRRRGFNYFLAEVVTAHNTSINFDQSTDYTYPDLPKNMLLPIPLSELAGNEAIDESNQNPGY